MARRAVEKRKRDFQRRKCLNIIVNLFPMPFEVTQDMIKVLMTDAKYWLNEGGKGTRIFIRFFMPSRVSPIRSWILYK